MKVAICCVKQKPDAVNCLKAFSDGVEKMEDEPVWMAASYQQLLEDFLIDTDVSVQVADSHPTLVNKQLVYLSYDPKDRTVHNFRRGIKEIQGRLNKRRIIIDAGLLYYDKQLGDNRYYVIGFDGMKTYEMFYNENSPPDRWKELNKLGVDMHPWRVSGEHILIIGQNEEGIGATNLTKMGMTFKEWSELQINNIRLYTDRKIIYRPHRHQRFLPEVEVDDCEIIELSHEIPISEHLKNCWCMVTAASGAAVDALVNGIPVITSDGLSVAYNVSEHSLENIESPAMKDRAQWLYDLAYTQWSVYEMRKGLPWEHLRPYVQIATV